MYCKVVYPHNAISSRNEYYALLLPSLLSFASRRVASSWSPCWASASASVVNRSLVDPFVVSQQQQRPRPRRCSADFFIRLPLCGVRVLAACKRSNYIRFNSRYKDAMITRTLLKFAPYLTSIIRVQICGALKRMNGVFANSRLYSGTLVLARILNISYLVYTRCL